MAHQFAELIRRGWSDAEVIGLAGGEQSQTTQCILKQGLSAQRSMSGNFLRVFEKIEAVAYDMRDVVPDMSIYDKRTDLPLKFR